MWELDLKSFLFPLCVVTTSPAAYRWPVLAPAWPLQMKSYAVERSSHLCKVSLKSQRSVEMKTPTRWKMSGEREGHGAKEEPQSGYEQEQRGDGGTGGRFRLSVH